MPTLAIGVNIENHLIEEMILTFFEALNWADTRKQIALMWSGAADIWRKHTLVALIGPMMQHLILPRSTIWIPDVYCMRERAGRIIIISVPYRNRHRKSQIRLIVNIGMRSQDIQCIISNSASAFMWSKRIGISVYSYCVPLGLTLSEDMLDKLIVVDFKTRSFE